MENDLKLIDDFIEGQLSKNEIDDFNNKIIENKAFAENVAFYLQAKQLSKLEQKNKFRELHEQIEGNNKRFSFTKNMGVFAAAASILFAVAWFFYFNTKINAEQYAQNYINVNLQTISTEMSVNANDISKATELYNEKKYAEALGIFKTINDNSLSTEYQGLCNLQLKDYPNALKNFESLAENKELLQNKGLFYQSLVLIKMNKTADAKNILLQIEHEPNAFGKNEAKELLKLMD